MQEVDLKAFTEEEWHAFYAQVVAEQERRRTLEEARALAASMIHAYEEAVESSPARPLADMDPQEVVGPGEKILDDQGVEWVNRSGAWLSPFAAGPSAYPMGWQKSGASAEPVEELPAWEEGHAYLRGDLVAFDGHAYRVVAEHTSQADWRPDLVPSLYTLD